MQILKAKFIILGNKDCEILENYAVAFDEKIRAIGNEQDLRAKFKNAPFYELKNAVIAPAFINTHVHLEFSAHKGELVYGDFVRWLGSIVQNANALAKKCTTKIINNALKSLLKSGVGTIGAISSFGKDLEALKNSPVRAVFFNEILGSNPDFIEQNFNFFKERFKASQNLSNARFIPAVSLHSPYSIHPKLAKKALRFAKEKNALVCTHFLESADELKWLRNGTGAFKEHLKKFINAPAPMYSPDSYLAMFKGVKTLFTHCVWADFKKLKFDPNFHSITHCATSNRLLGARALNLDEVLSSELSLNIGTDGLSSNLSLNFFDELRCALLTHAEIPLDELSKKLFYAATAGGAKALGLNLGELKTGALADIAVYKAPKMADKDRLITQLLLYTKRCEKLYINGKLVKF